MPVPPPTFPTPHPVRCQWHPQHSPHPILSDASDTPNIPHNPSCQVVVVCEQPFPTSIRPAPQPTCPASAYGDFHSVNSCDWNWMVLIQICDWWNEVDSLHYVQSSCWLHLHSSLACCGVSHPAHYCRWTVTVLLIPMNNSGQPCTGELWFKTAIFSRHPWSSMHPVEEPSPDAFCWNLQWSSLLFTLLVTAVVTISSLLSIICWNWPAHTVLISVTETVHHFFTRQWWTVGPLFMILVVQEFVAFRLASQLYILLILLTATH